MTSSLSAGSNELDEIRQILFDDISQLKTQKIGQGFSDLFVSKPENWKKSKQHGL